MSKQVATCTRLDSFGRGIVVIEKREIPVSNLLPGETAELEVFSSSAKVIKIIEGSPSRTKPGCRYYFDCGGCQLQHMSYEEQLRVKTSFVEDSFKNQNIQNPQILPIISMKEPTHYRNKNQMVVSLKNKKVMTGFFEENTHKIVNVDDCPIQDKIANEIIQTMRHLMEKHKILPYDEDKQSGLVRHLFVRVAPSTKEFLVVIVTSVEMFPGRNNFVKDLREKHPEITSIVQNVNERKTSMVLGDFERVLYGKGYIEDVLMGYKFTISSRTFYQVNTAQTEKLYQKAIELAKPQKEDVLVDAYSGIGTIGILFSSHVKKVICIEKSKESHKNAIENAKKNNVRNIRFMEGDATNVFDYLFDNQVGVDILLVDPPRSGLSAEFIQKVNILKPKKFVYISCDPVSLARDVKQLITMGYQLGKVQPVDMFPQTYHVENIALLSHKSS